MLSKIKKETVCNNKRMQFPMEFNKDFEVFKEKLKPLKGLDEGDKIGKDTEGNYIIFKAGMLQRAWRNYYGEDRNSTIEYLTEDFELYSNFLDRICARADNDLLNIFKDFAYSVSKYSQKIIERLYNLKKTYMDDSDNKKIIARIDSIILTLIDFKDKIIQTYETKNLAHMSLYLRNDRLTKSL